MAELVRTCVVVGVALVSLACGTRSTFAQDTKPDADYRQLIADAVRAAANGVLPSIVTVEQVVAVANTEGDVSGDAPTSGVIVSAEGHVLTSSLVTQNPAATLLVTLADGTRKAAKVVAQDYHRELVLLKIESDQDLTPIEISQNTQMRIGATVVAVGRYGAANSPIISRGVFSAVDRLDGVAIQTDARVSPSFYGGLLIDLSGQVLGVLIPAVAEGGAENITDWYDSGIAFAIPSHSLAVKLPRMMAGEPIKKGLLGIVARTQDPYQDGTEIATVRVRSPAEIAGLRAGDVVEAVAGKPVRRHLDIKQHLGAYDAGDTIVVRVRRGEESIDFDVQLAESIPPLECQRLGVVARRHSVDGDESSEVVVDGIVPKSPAEGMLEVDDVIQRIGNAEVHDLQTLRRILLTAQNETAVSILVRRGDQTKTIEVMPQAIASGLSSELPKSMLEKDAKAWSVETIKLPEAPNAAAVVAPELDSQRKRLGLMMLLLNPGDGAPETALKDWPNLASQFGVVVCAVAPQDNERWRPAEIEVVTTLAAQLIKQYAIEPAAVAVATEGAMTGKDSGAADSMAVAVAISEKRTFSGAAVNLKTRPPAVRVTENDPAMPLQFVLSVKEPSEMPTWAAPLQKAGYPIISAETLDQEQLLIWVRLLQAI